MKRLDGFAIIEILVTAGFIILMVGAAGFTLYKNLVGDTDMTAQPEEKEGIISDETKEALRSFFSPPDSNSDDEPKAIKEENETEIDVKNGTDIKPPIIDTDPIVEADKEDDISTKPPPYTDPIVEIEEVIKPEPEPEPIVQTGPQRTSGYPPGGNGASSFHLWWDVPGGQRFKEISATIEVKDVPLVNELYFWALSLSFYEEDGSSSGGAHTGIQWHSYSSGSPFKTVNWGGYDGSGNVLSGTESALPPKLNDPNDQNTRSYSWLPNRQYKLRVYKVTGSPGVWRAEIKDMSTGDTKVIRDLYGGGTLLGSPVVWSEVFAKCDDPSSSVIWRNFKGIKSDGQSVSYNAASVNYQSYNNSGCTNTNSQSVSGGIKQTTNTARTTQQGEIISF